MIYGVKPVKLMKWDSFGLDFTSISSGGSAEKYEATAPRWVIKQTQPIVVSLVLLNMLSTSIDMHRLAIV